MKLTKHLEIILVEQCKRVGASYDEIDFKEPNWFHKYEWDEQEEKDFTKWLSDYFYNNKEAREELLTSFFYKNKKRCREAAKEFVWQYGWKLKN